MSTDELDSAILDALVDWVALNRPSLIDEVVFEWDSPDSPPQAAEVRLAIDELAQRAWLRETEESDQGERYSVMRLTDEGRAEWRRRNPLEDRIERAWFAQGDFIYAPSEEIADRAAAFLDEDGPADVDRNVKNVQPWTYELDGSGDLINGVRVEYPAVRRLRRLRRNLQATRFLLRLRLTAWLQSRPRGRPGHQ